MFNLNIMIDIINVRKRQVIIKKSDNKGNFFLLFQLFRDEDRSVVSETIGLVN